MTEIKYLTHREAAELRLQGVELLWRGLPADYAGISVSIHDIDTQSGYYRAPRVFTHPGGTCPAPETEAPPRRTSYYVPDAGAPEIIGNFNWDDDNFDRHYLSRGLVYLTREAAIARSELMLAGVAK